MDLGKPICRRRTIRTAGFSLFELAVVLGIFLVAAAIAIPNVMTAVRDTTVAQGYNVVLMAIRQAREAAVAERRLYLVTLTAPASVTVAPLVADPTARNISAKLPSGIQFYAHSGLPNTTASTPDHFGTGAASGAINFGVGVGAGGTNTIYFYPDGVSRDQDGNMNSGVLYIARPSELMSSRAITVWGASGRIKGWRLARNNSGVYWRQQ